LFLENLFSAAVSPPLPAGSVTAPALLLALLKNYCFTIFQIPPAAAPNQKRRLMQLLVKVRREKIPVSLQPVAIAARTGAGKSSCGFQNFAALRRAQCDKGIFQKHCLTSKD